MEGFIELFKTITDTPIPKSLMFTGFLFFILGLLAVIRLDINFRGESLFRISAKRAILAILFGLTLLITGWLAAVQINPLNFTSGYILEINQKEADEFYNRGKGLIITGEYQKALELLEEATLLAPGHAFAWYQMGVALSRLEYASPHPSRVEKSFNTLELEQESQSFSPSRLSPEQAYSKAIEYNGQISAAFYELRNIKLGQQYWYINYRGKNGWILYNQEVSKYEKTLSQRQIEDAQSYFERAIEIDSNWEDIDPADAYYWQGISFEVDSLPSKAEESYINALKINPDHDGAKRQLVFLQRKG